MVLLPPSMSRLASAACAVLVAACLDPSYGRLSCPDDEVCSEATPAGLTFVGQVPTTALGSDDSALLPTALGGTQTIHLVDAHRRERLDLRFGAEMRGAALALVATTGDSVRVTGRAGGTGTLRITEPDGVTLHDRVSLATAKIEAVALVPLGELVPSTDRPVAWLAGTRADVAVRLLTATGGPVIDDSTFVSTAADVAIHADESWDHVVVAPAAEATPVTIHAGGTRFEAAIARVDAVDTIVAVLDAADSDGGALLCFAAHAGEQVVAGLDWRFDVDGAPATHFGAANCTMARPTARSRSLLTVTAGGARHTVDLGRL
jgi:hypothetical protein